MTRRIAYLYMDAFYASVELLRYPQLRGLPVVVGGGRRRESDNAFDSSTPLDSFVRLRDYAGRGVATTATYEARALGVHSALGLMKAAALAPDAVLLPADFDEYTRNSRLFKGAVAEIVLHIEDRGIDEIYIDLTDVSGDTIALAQKIKDNVRSMPIRLAHQRLTVSLMPLRDLKRNAAEFSRTTHDQRPPRNAPRLACVPASKVACTHPGVPTG